MFGGDLIMRGVSVDAPARNPNGAGVIDQSNPRPVIGFPASGSDQQKVVRVQVVEIDPLQGDGVVVIERDHGVAVDLAG